MTSFAILVKSHAPDFAYAERLLSSYARHNVDGVPLHLIVPDDEIGLFSSLAADNVRIDAESVLAGHLVSEPVAGFSPGYINQEIIKLSFWELGRADNYLCMDSDAEFVRDFHVSDFMADATTPYTFLTEDRELQAEPEYYTTTWVHRQPWLLLIAKEIGLASPSLRTVHGHAVFSGAVLKSFAERFLAPRGWDYVDALRIAPLEPTWYNFWLEKDQTIPVIMREPIIKTFHNSAQYLDYILRGVTRDDVARGYVGIVMNSNFSRGDGMVSLEDPPPLVLARYRGTKPLARAALRRLSGVARRKLD